jgi:tRNA modification GTPase
VAAAISVAQKVMLLGGTRRWRSAAPLCRAACARFHYESTQRLGSEDTIFALSSGHSAIRSAIAVVRLTGPHSKAALTSLLGDQQSFPKPRQASFRALYAHTDHLETGVLGSPDVLDRALVLWLPGPRTFTSEDIVELHLHGSPAVVSGVLDALSVLDGLRAAEPGEFSRRAFFNGKIDLTEAEALSDLLHSDTDAQRRQALDGMGGRASRQYEAWRRELMRTLAHCEALIDFAEDEDDVEDDVVQGHMQAQLLGLVGEMQRHLDESHRGEIVRDGVRVALVGRPNAGKSSLLNQLADRDVAIVSPEAGTTRDVLQVRVRGCSRHTRRRPCCRCA